MKKFKVISIIMAVALLGASLVGCGSSKETTEGEADAGQSTAEIDSETDTGETAAADDETGEKEQVTLRLADMSLYGIAVFNYAEEIGLLDGYYDDIPGYDVTVELSEWASGVDQNTAYAAGEIDFSIMGNIPAVTGTSNGLGTEILAVNYLYNDYVLVARAGSGVEKAEDLSGRNVGTYVGTVMHYAIAKYLENAGLSVEDVNLLNVAAETTTSLRSGDIDAGVLGNVEAHQLEAEGVVNILSEEQIPIYNYVVGNKEFAEKYPEITVRTLELINDTWDYALEHQQEYIEFYAEASGTDLEILELSWKDNFPVRYAKDFDETDYQEYLDFVEWMKTVEYVGEEINADDLLDLTYVKQLGE